jgi:hypothetical protein
VKGKNREGRGNRKGVKGREGMRGASKGEAQCSRITFKTVSSVDASKPVSTAKLMTQKPNCNLNRCEKNSLFSVPIIVTTSIIYYGICDFLTGSL